MSLCVGPFADVDGEHAEDFEMCCGGDERKRRLHASDLPSGPLQIRNGPSGQGLPRTHLSTRVRHRRSDQRSESVPERKETAGNAENSLTD